MVLVPPERGDPELSVVMVSHGAWDLTERAVRTLIQNTECPLELIVVDNRSDDEMRARLSGMPDTLVILNDENRGFGPATNQGVARARGTYVLLLNTDAFVHPGWLEPLVDTFGHRTTGAAVPRLLHLDGSLQEAGVLLARNGTVHVYGDGDDPNKLCYRFPRIVDSGSAACMLIRRSVFNELGGFDERYAPAYYEDADFSMRLAERGLDLVYEPRSTVTHVRYGSSGGGAAADLAERNRKQFADRWRERLIGRPWTLRFAPSQPGAAQAVIAARDALATPRVLIVAPPSSEDATRLVHTLLDLWPRGRVTWATGDPDSSRTLSSLPVGAELVAEPDPAWLAGRLFHYDLIALAGVPGHQLHVALSETQPQATRTTISSLLEHPQRLTDALAAAGVAPRPPIST